VRCQWHRREHREDVDHESLRVEEQRQRGPEARHSAHEVCDQEDPLTRCAIAGDRDERRDERTRHHPGEQHDADGARAARCERHHSQSDKRCPLGGVETPPRELRPPQPRIGPELAQRGEPLGDARAGHAASIAGARSEHYLSTEVPRARRPPPAGPHKSSDLAVAGSTDSSA